MNVESVRDRVLGAVRFVDATTLAKVSDGLDVTPDAGIVHPNRSGLYVIWSAPGNGPLGMTVTDKASRYLKRRFSVPLPRDPDPTHADQPGSIFQAVDVRLFPAPTAVVSPGWALIRATVTKAGTDQPLPGALIRVLRASDLHLLASGLSDARGESLVAVAGIPITTFDGGSGPVMSTSVDVTIQTVFDPALTGAPDPDSLEARKDTLPSSSVKGKLASGQVLITNLTVSVP